MHKWSFLIITVMTRLSLDKQWLWKRIEFEPSGYDCFLSTS